mmetsp:Transcript_94161/g.293303  ORF Transcript_94161/g.293303 Transcript_94161/m.293303 type:complete len:206 (+) Transcript_94161:1-618(+)
MVLHDVPDDAVAVEVAGTPLHADGLLEGDAHVGDVVLVEQVTQLPVREAEGQQVEHQGLGEVVVDPEGLALVQVLREAVGELSRLLAVLAERLLDDHAAGARLRPAVEAELLHRLAEEEGRQGEVEDAVVPRAALRALPDAAVQLLHSARVIVAHGNKVHALAKLLQVLGHPALLPLQENPQAALPEVVHAPQVRVELGVVAAKD